MNTDSKKNPAPLAPTSAEPSNATGSKPPRVAMPLKGKLMKKTGNAKGGPGTDPYAQPKPSRKFVTADGHRAGARYGIRVGFQKQTAPEASSTQGNGRIIPASTNRSRPNFSAGMVD
jgi:hypothetical protein